MNVAFRHCTSSFLLNVFTFYPVFFLSVRECSYVLTDITNAIVQTS